MKELKEEVNKMAEKNEIGGAGFQDGQGLPTGESANGPVDPTSDVLNMGGSVDQTTGVRRPGVGGSVPGESMLPPSKRKTLAQEVEDLEAEGFTENEAVRLIGVSERVAHSGEAREAEELLRRLRFTRWLIEHGMLDEFSA